MSGLAGFLKNALALGIVRPPKDENGLMLIGDSTTNQNTTQNLGLNLGYELIERANGYAIWMNALLKEKRFDRLYNYGISGRRALAVRHCPGAAQL